MDIPVGMTIHDTSEDVGKVVERIDVVDLAGLNQRDGCPCWASPSEPTNKVFFGLAPIWRMEKLTQQIPQNPFSRCCLKLRWLRRSQSSFSFTAPTKQSECTEAGSEERESRG
jgi:hypothetical protein